MMTESHHKLGPAEMANLAAAYVPVRKACFAGISRNSPHC